ncbi:hypothetical protein Pyn_39622 [Prunus yedoensis var. nudiflora]|uniref:Uncharacterized protein n=1 Tax=Prunus yedoensis var. nudiflora TaxID=2094558 RepID=A0A314UMR2_PRUYE|nr:hypothetical protein Pyn_39622 [Prunus yedoensis var. nudiflora]
MEVEQRLETRKRSGESARVLRSTGSREAAGWSSRVLLENVAGLGAEDAVGVCWGSRACEMSGHNRKSQGLRDNWVWPEELGELEDCKQVY